MSNGSPAGGTGFLYVRKSRIASTWPLMACDQSQTNDIRKFEEIGTHPAANHDASGEALVFNENIGIDRKAARLRYLRDRWANRLAQNPNCRILRGVHRTSHYTPHLQHAAGHRLLQRSGGEGSQQQLRRRIRGDRRWVSAGLAPGFGVA
jgi:selenocysteine lyase/cysteine desulfurase